MRARVVALTRELLVSVDQLAHVLLGAPKFILLGGNLPSADETVSSVLGRQALRGKRWAVVCAAVVDWVFAKLGEPNHCNANIEWDEIPVHRLPLYQRGEPDQ